MKRYQSSDYKILAINAFVMNYYAYKKNWTPFIGDELQVFMQLTNKLDKYTVTVKGKDVDVNGHLPLGKSGKFAKILFYFLKSDKSHYCEITLIRKITNACGRLEMKVVV